MAQAAYNALGQGPATIPMPYPSNQQRIIAPPVQTWCTPRRTKIIVAIVILTLLWIAIVVIWAVAKSAAEQRYISYSSYDG